MDFMAFNILERVAAAVAAVVVTHFAESIWHWMEKEIHFSNYACRYTENPSFIHRKENP